MAPQRPLTRWEEIEQLRALEQPPVFAPIGSREWLDTFRWRLLEDLYALANFSLEYPAVPKPFLLELRSRADDLQWLVEYLEAVERDDPWLPRRRPD